jgi:hypothetical protein
VQEPLEPPATSAFYTRSWGRRQRQSTSSWRHIAGDTWFAKKQVGEHAYTDAFSPPQKYLKEKMEEEEVNMISNDEADDARAFVSHVTPSHYDQLERCQS